MTLFAFPIVYRESKQVIQNEKIVWNVTQSFNVQNFNSDQEKSNENNSERQDVEEGNMNDLVNLCMYWENLYLPTRNNKKKDVHVGGWVVYFSWKWRNPSQNVSRIYCDNYF